MSDENDEAERAVERWVKLGDQVVTGKSGGQPEEASTRTCAACGTTFRVLPGGDDRALCARCYLQRGPGAAS